MLDRSSKRSFTIEQTELIWTFWKSGHSLSEIGRAMNKHAASIFCFLQKFGGINPGIAKRPPTSLTLHEREEISRGISANLSFRAIARQLNRSPSTISREINRNGGLTQYRAMHAEKRAWREAKRPKVCLLKSNETLRHLVEEKLERKWSPEQIAGWLKRTYPETSDKHVSHETIYRTLFIQARGELKKTLLAHLRTKRVMRQSKQFNTKGNCRGGIIDAVSIHDRPNEVDDRVLPGHWEGDLICGTHHSFVATLVERTSRFTLLVKLVGNNTEQVTKAIQNKMCILPQALRKTLTWDRGMELAKHKQFTIDTNINVYFCDPRSPWQRGTNENTNRLIRQYLPKKTDLSLYTQEALDEIADSLNGRPRKTLQFLSPREKIEQVLQ